MTPTHHRRSRLRGITCAALRGIACIALVLGAPALSAGTLRVNGQPVDFPDGARLESMVPTLLAVQDAYWPASRVRTEASRQAAGELKQRVLAQLQSLGGEAEQLRRAVEQFRPFGGLDQPLDPDLIRLQERANPRLVGDYELVAPARPKHILIIGMTRQAGKLPIGEAPVGSHSVDPAAYLEGADKAWLYLIGPQGSVRRTGVAAFNARRLDVLPGSTVFVPVDPDRLDERTRTLNDDIVKLLAGGEEWTHE